VPCCLFIAVCTAPWSTSCCLVKCALQIELNLTLIGVQNVPVFLHSSPEGKKLSKRRLSPVGSLQSSEDASETSRPSGAPDPSATSDPQPPPIGGSPSPGPSAAPDPTEHQNLALLQPKPEPEEHESECTRSKYQSLLYHVYFSILEMQREQPCWSLDENTKGITKHVMAVCNVWCEGNPECIMTWLTHIVYTYFPTKEFYTSAGRFGQTR